MVFSFRCQHLTRPALLAPQDDPTSDMGQAQALHILQVSLARGKLVPGARIRYDVEGQDGLGCRRRGDDAIIFWWLRCTTAHRKFLDLGAPKGGNVSYRRCDGAAQGSVAGGPRERPPVVIHWSSGELGCRGTHLVVTIPMSSQEPRGPPLVIRTAHHDVVRNDGAHPGVFTGPGELPRNKHILGKVAFTLAQFVVLV